MKMYGEFLDDSQRCETDVNEIVIYDDYAEIVLYDLLFEPLEYGVIIDKEDVEKVKLHCWSKKNGCIVANQFGRHVLLPNIILETDEKIEYINGDYLDCRKENLKIVEKKNKKSRNNYSVSKRNKNKVIVEIIGANRHQVTGSATLISIPLKEGGYKRILIELGGNQTNQDLYTEYLRNKEIVESVPHNEIDYVFALHAHYDHIGNLPSLIPNGFNGKLITNKENREIMTPMLVDGAFIMNKNVQALNKKHNITHLYKEEDVYLLMSRCETYSMNEIHALDDLVSFQFVSAGHILGSCQLILYLKTPTGQIKKLHFTSDLGSDYNKQPFVKPKDIVNSSNFSLFEATYNELDRGFKSKKECEREREEFKKFLKNELKNKRNILIGVFAQARQQTMMEFLYRSFKDDKDFNYPIYVDGVLGLTLNNCYLSVLEGEDREYWKEVMSWENFKYISSYEKSMNVACNKSEISIKISSSGMFSNGRIMNHVKTMIEDSNCTFVLCGYQGEGTVGRELQRTDNTEVKIEGMMFKKKCKIYQMNTW